MSKLKTSKKSERSVFNNLFSEVSGGWCLPLLLVGLLSLESISFPSHVGDVSIAKLSIHPLGVNHGRVPAFSRLSSLETRSTI
jgi:hypothetical protein